RLQRKFYFAPVARRGRLWQACPVEQNARERCTEIRQPQTPAGLYVCPGWQKAPLYGWGVRPVARMEPRYQPGLASARGCTTRWPATVGSGPESFLSADASAL